LVPPPLALTILNDSLTDLPRFRHAGHLNAATGNIFLRRPLSMRALVLSAPLLVALSAGAMAANPTSTGASNIGPQDTPSTIAPALPSPNLPEGARPSDALRAAQGALAAGHTGETQDALEMAETRMLDRSVALGQTNNPSDNPTVRQISQALRALAAHDRTTCMQWIQTALRSATAQGL
jgi:hypothetical protein